MAYNFPGAETSIQGTVSMVKLQHYANKSIRHNGKTSHNPAVGNYGSLLPWPFLEELAGQRKEGGQGEFSLVYLPHVCSMVICLISVSSLLFTKNSLSLWSGTFKSQKKRTFYVDGDREHYSRVGGW